MNMNKEKKLLLVLAGIFWALALTVFLVSNEQFRYVSLESETTIPNDVTVELTDGVVLEQKMDFSVHRITDIALLPATHGRVNTGTLNIALLDSAGNALAEVSADVSQLSDGQAATFPLTVADAIPLYEGLTVRLTTDGCTPGNAVSVYCNNAAPDDGLDVVHYTLNGEEGAGRLCLTLYGGRDTGYARTFWLVIAGVFAMLALYTFLSYRRGIKGKRSGIMSICLLYCRYSFLLKQLVNRDFKTKYKRSALGMAWSFLNPLLTMAVQYFVFARLFKSDTVNYPVYLLTGIVFFGFFSEAVSQGMTSITGNSSLIKKVYIPKYIFPFSKLFSSLINFALSLIPLLLLMLVTQTPIRPALVLLVFDILCMMGFVLGMILLLSTAMTFFQDTQFLWGVFSMLWMYLTPVFYTESIIPQNMRTIYHINPLYQFITFARTCIIDGVSPDPLSYMGCALSAIVFLLLGIFAFKRHQDRFVVHL